MRFLWKALLVIIITLIAGNWLLDDVGYVLIRYRDVAIETSLLIATLVTISFLLVMAWVIHRLPRQQPKKQRVIEPITIEESPMTQEVRSAEATTQLSAK